MVSAKNLFELLTDQSYHREGRSQFRVLSPLIPDERRMNVEGVLVAFACEKSSQQLPLPPKTFLCPVQLFPGTEIGRQCGLWTADNIRLNRSTSWIVDYRAHRS